MYIKKKKFYAVWNLEVNQAGPMLCWLQLCTVLWSSISSRLCGHLYIHISVSEELDTFILSCDISDT